MRMSSGRQLTMCSNISTETMRSNASCGTNSFMSAVITERLRMFALAAWRRMNSRCEAEFDTDVMRELG